jgi:NAD(P)-dependent dehydrogenase (short-subunit alcohol dehydrogenase family)
MSSSSNPALPLEGKVFAITGGASGIGLATAKILSKRGATICIADVDEISLQQAGEYFSSASTSPPPPPSSTASASFMLTRMDVSKRAEVDGWMDSIVQTYGRLDGAANVAGIIGKAHGIATVAELDDGEWDRIIAVNLTGTMYCLRAELRRIVDGGSIVNVSSIHGIKGLAREQLSFATSPPPSFSPPTPSSLRAQAC